MTGPRIMSLFIAFLIAVAAAYFQWPQTVEVIGNFFFLGCLIVIVAALVIGPWTPWWD